MQNLKPEAIAIDLAPDQVLLRVHAVGVNFRDVLNVLGMYPGDPGAPGADCAGLVAAKGCAVQGLDLGEFASFAPESHIFCVCHRYSTYVEAYVSQSMLFDC